jgi:hypothetical protein
MAYELTTNGELDRDKVLAELDKIFARLPIPLGAPLDGIVLAERQKAIRLINQAINQAQVDTEKWCRD